MQKEQAKFLLSYIVPAIEEEFRTNKKVLAAIPEDQRDYRPDSKSRTALELAWHIASSDVWFLEGIVTGNFPMDEGQLPSNVRSIADILSWYEQNFSSSLEKVKALSEEQLVTPIPFFGIFNHPAVMYLSFLSSHSIHHRGQLSTYLRPMGSKVPSIYGGSADEPFSMAAQA